jgi:indole-3-glycerol phosphate synthase
LAAAYAEGGAAALSVLTDREYFQGSLDDLGAARRATQLPVLRKDFILDETQIAEAFAAGADAILLIAAILDAPALRRLREFAGTLALDVLVEAHDEAELDRAIESGATILGVNNRDLHTFDVSLETSLRLARRMPAGVVAVSESGIRTRADVQRLLDAGYSAFLVGEHLMKSPDPAAALRELLG